MHELIVIGGPVVVSTVAAFGVMQIKPFFRRRLPQMSVRRRRWLLGLFLADACVLLLLLQWTYAH